MRSMRLETREHDFRSNPRNDLRRHSEANDLKRYHLSIQQSIERAVYGTEIVLRIRGS